MKLSIGMIVKNEEKYLDECLTALHPILENVDSELIIVDTGSTDKTVETANKHTDKVYFFEWINDFAAARNEGLKHAKGEWFLFIDADEILVDAKEIIKFFNSGEEKKYNTARYYIANVTNNDGKEALVLLNRFHRIFDNTLFNGEIHEYIQEVTPTKELKRTKFMHYGYFFENPKLAKKKAQRNLVKLLEKYNANEKTPKVYSEICDAYSMMGELDKTILFAEEGLKECEENGEHFFYYNLKLSLITAYFRQGRYNYVIAEVNDMVERVKCISNIYVDSFFYMSLSCFNLGEYDMSISSIEKYLQYVDLFVKGLIDAEDKRVVCVQHYSETTINDITICLANSYIKTKNYKRAKKILCDKQFDDLKNVNINNYLLAVFGLAKETTNYEIIKNIYTKLLNNTYEKEKILGEFELFAEKYLNSNIDEKEIFDGILNIICDFNIDRQYVVYLKIRRKILNDNNYNIENDIINFIEKTDKLELKYSNLLFYIIKYNVPGKYLENKCHPEEIAMHTSVNIDFNDEMYECLVKYEKNYDSYILYYIYSTALYKIDEKRVNYLDEILNRYLVEFKSYYNEIYKGIDNIESKICYLPAKIRFGYKMMEAYNILNEGRKEEYIKCMESAADEDVNAINLVKLIIDRYKEKVKNDIKNINEFAILADKIKNNIVQLINNSNYEDAILLLNEYKLINPNDAEITRLEKKIKIF